MTWDLCLVLVLPVTGTFSNVNRFEFGKKRKTTAGLVQQNYKISIGFSLNDRWFEKRVQLK
jgi:hypothetical protein